MLRVGSPVQLHSLVKQPELNGLRGTIVKAADTATGRFAVRMDELSTATRPPRYSAAG